MAKQLSLEETIKRIEEIANKLSGEITIDESIVLYTEAVKLIEFASGKLESARQKVEKLSPREKENQINGQE